jgi:S1-C subfamily serine protease
MKRIIVLAALLALVAAPAFAGKKCEAGTQDCLNQMVKNMKNKGLIGVDGEWDEATGTFTITEYIDGSNAKASGVHIGDQLVAVNGIALNDKEASYADYPNRTPGSVAEITVVRGGAKKHMKVELVGLTEEQTSKYVGQHMIEHAEVQMAKVD